MEAATEEMEEDLPIPKSLKFNKPFFIALKKVNSRQPYFAAWIADTTLMKYIK